MTENGKAESLRGVIESRIEEEMSRIKEAMHGPLREFEAKATESEHRYVIELLEALTEAVRAK